MASLVSQVSSLNLGLVHASGAGSPGASSTPVFCNVYIGREGRFALEAEQVGACLLKKNMAVQEKDLANASHYFLFVTDSFLKTKEQVLPLIQRLSDPYFKQRVFAVIMDKSLSIFSPGSELKYVEYWSDILKNTSPNGSEHGEVRLIEENVATLIRVLRDSLMPPLDQLLQEDLKPITDLVEKRSHLLETKRFFFLPQGQTYLIGRKVALVKISTLFASKPVVVITGGKGTGKSTLAIEYAKNSTTYRTGIFWLDATNQQTLEESYRQLATQLGMNVDQAKKELMGMRNVLLIFANVKDTSLVPSLSFGHTLIVGTDLPNGDIVLKNFTPEDADNYVLRELKSSPEEARSLASVLENHPGKIADAIVYIKKSKLTVGDYVNFYRTDKDSLLTKQQGHKAVVVAAPASLPSRLDPSPQTIEKFNKLSADELSKEMLNQEIQIFISYNWGSTKEVDQIDSCFKQMGMQPLRDVRELRSFASIKEFMKKVIREADYTFMVITSPYLKSFNCLFEVMTTLQDPYWNYRVFPIVLPGTDLTEQALFSYEKHWQQEAEKLEKAGGSPEEVALAQEGARKLVPFLRTVNQMEPELLEMQLTSQFQKAMALMLARQERLEKKGIYKQEIFHLPMGRNKDFTGREKELSQLERSLNKGTYGAITNTGMGGVGKSQLALEYAYRHEKEYEMVYWIRSESIELIKTDLRMLGLEMGIHEDFLKEDKVIPTMRSALEKKKGWLLVFDNAEDPDLLAKVMPQQGGHIIVTSRNPNWEKAVTVDVFSKEEALAYLQKISGISDQEDDLKLIAEELGYLPLALTQAGAYIKRQQITVAAYLSAFKEGQKQFLSQKERGYPESVATAWLLSIEKITQEDPNALHLLNMCGYLAPDRIPQSLLNGWLKQKTQKTTELDFHDALRILESYSLIDQKVEQKGGSQKKWINIHRLIQTVTRDQIAPKEAKTTLTAWYLHSQPTI